MLPPLFFAADATAVIFERPMTFPRLWGLLSGCRERTAQMKGLSVEERPD